jgi:hypothetical protein
MKTMTVAAMIAACAGVFAQDEKKDDGKKQAIADAAKALRATAKAGGFDVAGESKVESDAEGMVVGDFGWGGLSGKIAGSVTFPLEAAFRLDAGKARYELWSSKGQAVERLTWKGRGAYPDRAADELLSLVNLEKLAADVEKATAAKARDGGVIELTLSGDAIREHVERAGSDEEGGGIMMEMGLTPSSVTLKLTIGKDGLVGKLEAAVLKKFNMGEGEEEGEEEEGQNFEVTVAYTLALAKHGAAKVEIPADVREQLKEKE